MAAWKTYGFAVLEAISSRQKSTLKEIYKDCDYAFSSDKSGWEMFMSVITVLETDGLITESSHEHTPATYKLSPDGSELLEE